MKKVIFTLIAIISVSMSNLVFAQPVGGSGAMITVDKESHDYGTLEQGADGLCYFVITNTGDEPLIISTCKQSCGCTTPECPTEPIAPGKCVKITVKYDTNRVGPINKSVTIISNATNEPSKIIRITGNILAKPATTVSPTK